MGPVLLWIVAMGGRRTSRRDVHIDHAESSRSLHTGNLDSSSGKPGGRGIATGRPRGCVRILTTFGAP